MILAALIILPNKTSLDYRAQCLADGQPLLEMSTLDRLRSLVASARLRFPEAKHLGKHGRPVPEELRQELRTVAASGPRVPESLRDQLAVGGRLVMPVGPSTETQELVLVTRKDAAHFEQRTLADVRFVPLVGAEGWEGA